MLNFKKLDKDEIKIKVNELKNYFEKNEMNFCDISVGTKYLWRKDFLIEYAIFNNTLIMKETSPDYNNYFYYPIGDDENGALNEIEKYCSEKNLGLNFCCVDNAKASVLAERYFNVKIFNDRNWSDYIYDAKLFYEYKGKKYSGQRNHVNKFIKNFPNFKFQALEEKDFLKVEEFFSEYKREKIMTLWSEKDEAEYVLDYIKNFKSLFQLAAAMWVNDKIIGISLGEIVNKTLIVHVEKALTSYEGVYPTIAKLFAEKYCNENVLYINREEDCGDPGLRISKMQYQPIEIKEKNFVLLSTAFDYIKPPIIIKTSRLIINDICLTDQNQYFLLYTNKEINKYWGYDYNEDLIGEATPQYFYNFQKKLKLKKEEYSFAVRLENNFIGELVLYNFDYFGNAEIGFRFFNNYQHKGFAFESSEALINFAAKELKLKSIKVRCYKENTDSKKLIEKLKFKFLYSDEEKNYYIKNLV